MNCAPWCAICASGSGLGIGRWFAWHPGARRGRATRLVESPLQAPLRCAAQEIGVTANDRRRSRDLHALNEDGMVLCNPRDREAAHRAEMEGITTENRAEVTCRRCRSLLYAWDK